MSSSLKWRHDWDDEEAEVAALQRLADEKSEEEDDEIETDEDEEDDEEKEEVKREVGGKCAEMQHSTEQDSEEIITSDMPTAESLPIVIATENEDSTGVTYVDPPKFKDSIFPDNEEGRLQQFSVVVENPVDSSPLELTDIESPQSSAEIVNENQVNTKQPCSFWCKTC